MKNIRNHLWLNFYPTRDTTREVILFSEVCYSDDYRKIINKNLPRVTEYYFQIVINIWFDELSNEHKEAYEN